MTDWTEALGLALVSGKPDYMRSMLANVPPDVRERALHVITQAARSSLGQNNPAAALGYLDQLIELVPDELEWQAQRTNALLALKRYDEARTAAERLIAAQPAIGLAHVMLARAHEGLGDMPQALAAYRAAHGLGSDPALDARIAELARDIERRTVIERMTQPDAAMPPSSPPAPTRLTSPEFDPALLLDGDAVSSDIPAAMVDGIREHLRRYSVHQNAKNALARVEDEAWIACWDRALGSLGGARVRLCGSELGVLALRARAHGAASVCVVEAQALNAHIAGGIVHKNLLIEWHRTHADEIARWSEEQRRDAFAAYARTIELLEPDADALRQRSDDALLLPDIDHSLLGTGIVAAIRRQRELGLAPDARLLPARARVFAQALEWQYPSVPFALDALNELRWSHYPQPFEFAPDAWRALTAPAEVATIDFEAGFSAGVRELRLPVIADGTLDAIVYWFELELGQERFVNAPGSVSAIKPAVQHADGQALSAGGVLELDLHLSETRLTFQARPPLARKRRMLLPSWYVPMVLDSVRNEAYAEALRRTLAERPSDVVLDVGAGCGILSMLAARAGARRVYGCELSESLQRVGREVVARNGCADNVELLHKDCRQLSVPGDLPGRADLILFEMFDCSLIGEGVLHYLAHTREHLASGDARWLPCAGRIHAMLVEYRVERALDVDINLLNPYRYSPAFIALDAEKSGVRALSDAREVFAFDFATATPQPQQREIAFEVTAAGTAGAVLFWIELDLGHGVTLSTAPGQAWAPHWQQGLQFLPELRVEPALRLALEARHDGASLAFRWKESELPTGALSRLPRFDPRWLQQATELEAQTQRLLQHILSNPSEYAKAADLAGRFALDPARHGLDARIAQRFAATFFGQ